MAAHVNTVLGAMILCGTDNHVQFNGHTAAQRIAVDIFDDDFMSRIDKDINDLEDDLKSYSSLTITQGQIRLTPGTKRNLRAFIQWSNDQIHTGEEPAEMGFPVADAPDLIRYYRSHKAFCEKSKRVSDTANPPSPQLDENAK